MSIGNEANFYYDLHGLDDMRRAARKDAGKALNDVARQFEGIFVKMMMKSMRQASMGEDIMSSETEKFYRDMYDDQLVVEMNKSGSIGLADIIVKQLQNLVPMRQTDPLAERDTNNKTTLNPQIQHTTNQDEFIQPKQVAKAIAQYRATISQNDVVSQDTSVLTSGDVAQDDLPREPKTPTEFVHSVWNAATKAAEELGVSPVVLVAQAALETGWGKSVLKKADGTSSNNLFNIKANQSWSGDKVGKDAIEFVGGVKVREQSNFRAYATVEESFSDYVNFLRTNPRYMNALAKAGDPKAFADELQSAGYATDPEYAEKIKRVMGGDDMKSAITQMNAMHVESTPALES